MVVRRHGGCEDGVQPLPVMKLVLFICALCSSNRLKKVERWPTEFLENTPGLSESFSSVATVLTTDCPGKDCEDVSSVERVQIGAFQSTFGAIVKAVTETVALPAFVSLYRDSEGDDEDDCGDEEEDANEVSFRCFVPVFSKDELNSMFQVESTLCGFVKQGGKFVPYIFTGVG